MLKSNYLPIILAFLVCLTLFHCSAENSEIDAVASSQYDDLVSLFQEFREFQKPKMINSVPDYAAAAIEEQRRGLKKFQGRLAAMNIQNWPVSQQVDYHLVRAEMNGMDFYQRVLKPWSRDPVFYLPSQGGAGPVIRINLRIRNGLPLSKEKLEEFRKTLKAIPEIYKQAKGNLTEAAGDLAEIAIHYIDREALRYKRLASRLAEHHPDLVPDAERAEDYSDPNDTTRTLPTRSRSCGKYRMPYL